MKIIIKNATVSFGENIVLNDINFEISESDKVAIVGRNGSGKTTLLKLITQELKPDFVEGKIEPQITFLGSPTVGYLKQISFTSEDVSLEEEILTIFKQVITILEDLTNLEKELKINSTEKNIAKYVQLEELFRLNGGYTYKKEYNQAFKKFGFSEQDKTKKIKEFSGGERTKIALIKLLLSKPDVLILDEPTNHLDIKTIEWLEEYLASYKKAVIVVSHDRAFLDNVVSTVYEVEHNKIKKYAGNYTKFIQAKKENYERDKKAHERYEAEKQRLENSVDRFRYKATKASMAQSKIKQIQRMEEVQAPAISDSKTFKINLQPKTESATEVIKIEKLLFGYGSPIGEVSLRLVKNERLGIIGANGTGKSTLLKTINGIIPLLGGKIKFGQNVEVGYFDQQTATSRKLNKTVLEDYQEAFQSLSTEEARTDLGSFLFSKDDVFKDLSSLSGGELVRLELLKIFKTKPNLLMLDEPTNHMDILSKEQLEDVLLNYKGTIIFVSHDRYFINKLATSLIVFDESGVVKYLPSTTYESYENSFKKKKIAEEVVLLQKTEVIKEKKSPSQYKIDKEKTKLISKLERDIQKKEEQIKELNKKYYSPEIMSDSIALMEISNEIEKTQASLDELMERWLELNN